MNGILGLVDVQHSGYMSVGDQLGHSISTIMFIS